MRAFGRDLIRGGHYGQRSCEPHLKAEHMAAPTNAAYVKKALANSEPSTHGTSRISGDVRLESAKRAKADIDPGRRHQSRFYEYTPSGRPEPVVPGCLTSAISRRGRTALPKRQRPLPVEIVADVLVAIAGIEPQTAVERER